MGVHVITEFHAKPGRSDALIALLGQSIPDSRAHAGCEDISVRQDQDDRSHIASLTTWTTRRHYEEYLAWRTGIGDTDTFGQLLDQPMSVRYYDEVQSN